MKCENFAAWLENRDVHDVSEADKAYRHAEECKRCYELLKKDEMLERFIADSLCSEPLPASLKHSIDLSLERSVPRRSGKSIVAVISAVCLAVVIFLGITAGNDQGFSSLDEFGNYLQADYNEHGHGSSSFDPVTDPAIWFAENTGEVASPPELLVAGYVAKGAKFCHLGHCKAIHMIYEKDEQLVSLFVVEDEEFDFPLEAGKIYYLNIDGDEIKLYKNKNKVYALVT